MLGLIVLAIEENDSGAAFLPCEDLLGVRILARSIAGALPTETSVSGVLLVPERLINHIRQDVVNEFGLDEIDRIIPGSANRWNALQAGLEALPKDLEWVIVQDGHRALTPIGLIDRVLEAASSGSLGVPAVPTQDVIGEQDATGKLVAISNKSALRIVQGPLVIKRTVLEELVAKALEDDEGGGDLALYASQQGLDVAMVDGDPDNLLIRDQRDIGRSLEAFSRRAVEFAFLYPRGMLPDDPLKDVLASGSDVDEALFEDETLTEPMDQ